MALKEFLRVLDLDVFRELSGVSNSCTALGPGELIPASLL